MSSKNRSDRKQTRQKKLRHEALEARQLMASDLLPGMQGPEPLSPPALISQSVAGSDVVNASAPNQRVLQSRLTVEFYGGGKVGAGITVKLYDASGSFVLSRVTDGDSTVRFPTSNQMLYRATAEFTLGGAKYYGLVDFTGYVSTGFDVQKADIIPNNIPVNGKNSITVHVEGKNGKPQENVAVRIRNSNGTLFAQYRTNRNGMVEFRELGERRYTIEVWDASKSMWLRPGGKDFATTGSTRWTPYVKVG